MTVRNLQNIGVPSCRWTSPEITSTRSFHRLASLQILAVWTQAITSCLVQFPSPSCGPSSSYSTWTSRTTGWMDRFQQTLSSPEWCFSIWKATSLLALSPQFPNLESPLISTKGRAFQCWETWYMSFNSSLNSQLTLETQFIRYVSTLPSC